MAYRDQNYKINRKIKEEVDKNQVGYIAPEDQPEGIQVIKKVFVYVTDKKGNILNDVTLTFDEKEFIIGKYGLLISQLPNEANTITATKEGYKDATTDILIDAVIQTHEFYLALESSDEESEVISIDNTSDEDPNEDLIKGEILFEPPLDGTDEITSWSGTNTTADGVYSAHGSFLTDGWSNSGLWQLEYDVAYTSPGTQGYIGIMPVCSEEINPFTDAKGNDYALSAWEGFACLTGLGLTANGPINYKYSGREYYHHAILKKIDEETIEYYFDDNMWILTVPKLKNLTTLHIGARDNPASYYTRGTGSNILYKNIKVYSLSEPNQNNNTPSQDQQGNSGSAGAQDADPKQEGPSLDSITTETMTEEEGEF